MKIRFENGEFKEEELELPDGSKVQNVLDRFNIIYSFVLTLVNDIPVPLDQELVDSDCLKVLTVVSGG